MFTQMLNVKIQNTIKIRFLNKTEQPLIYFTDSNTTLLQISLDYIAGNQWFLAEHEGSRTLVILQHKANKFCRQRCPYEVNKKLLVILLTYSSNKNSLHYFQRKKAFFGLILRGYEHFRSS
jgi:hypothetical protein